MANTYKKIQTITVGAGGSSTINFTSIPQGYTDLRLVVSARSAYSSTKTDGLSVAFNGSTSGFITTYLYGYGTNYISNSSYTNYFGEVPSSTTTANSFSNTTVYLSGYTSNTYKAFSCNAVAEAATSTAQDSTLMISSGSWSNTAAINQITLSLSSASNFLQYSVATLYGISNANATTTPSVPNITSVSDLAGGVATVNIATSSPAAGLYTVTATPGNITATGLASPSGTSNAVLLPGLSPNTTYAFSATATNSMGTSAASAPTVGSALVPFNGFVALATVTVGTPTGSLYFTSIPQNYSHLQLRMFGKNTGTSGSFDFSWMIFNSDSGANYTYHRLFGDGSTAQVGSGTGSTAIYYGEYPTTTGYANIFGAGVMDILDYSNTSKNKTVRNLFGHDENGSGRVGMYSGFWNNTAAITSIQLNGNSYNFQTGMTVVLYGVK
jgi:hypothetical protein